MCFCTTARFSPLNKKFLPSMGLSLSLHPERGFLVLQSLNSVLCDAFSNVAERTVLKEENGVIVEGENGVYNI